MLPTRYITAAYCALASSVAAGNKNQATNQQLPATSYVSAPPPPSYNAPPVRSYSAPASYAAPCTTGYCVSSFINDQSKCDPYTIRSGDTVVDIMSRYTTDSCQNGCGKLLQDFAAVNPEVVNFGGGSQAPLENSLASIYPGWRVCLPRSLRNYQQVVY